MPFGGESGWDFRLSPRAMEWLLTSSVPFGGESGWDPPHPPGGSRRVRSSVPFGGESGWDEPAEIWRDAERRLSSVPFGGESGWDKT